MEEFRESLRECVWWEGQKEAEYERLYAAYKKNQEDANRFIKQLQDEVNRVHRALLITVEQRNHTEEKMRDLKELFEYDD